MIRFFVLTGLVSTTVAATVGVSSSSSEASPVDRRPSIWLTWWLGDAAGDALFAPLLILWAEKPRSRWETSKLVEGGLLLLSLIVVGQLVFGSVLLRGPRDYPIDFLAVPPLVWAAFRFGQRETATASFVLAAMALWGTPPRPGPLPSRGPQ